MTGRVVLACGIAISLLAGAIVGRRGQPAAALAATPNDVASDPTPYDAIDSYVQRQLGRLNVPGAALAIVEGDQIVHQRSFGEAHPGAGPATPQTPFAIGSLTKSFTALAVMQLVEANKIDLDAPVQRYLPWFRVANAEASAQVTVRQLLNQTSGFSMASGLAPMSDFDSSPTAAERQARALANTRLDHPPGSAWIYSNTNYNLLGLIVEAVSGQDYAAYVQDHIFGPLDMRHTYTTRGEAQRHGLALGYRYWFGQPIADPDEQSPAGSLASGQLISTTEDMSHYLSAQMNGGRHGAVQVLSPSAVAEMHRPAVDATTMGASVGQYGMGWFIDTKAPTTTLWHDGNVPDFFGYMALLPEQHKGLILLLNVDHFVMFQLGLLDIGQGAATLPAGGQPHPIWPTVMPWLMRSLLLIPILQIVGVAVTLRKLRRWRADPNSRPSGGRKWAVHVGLPLIPSALLGATPVLVMSSSFRDFLFLSGPDLSWTAVICGGFAGLWLVIRTGLVVRTLRKGEPPKRLVQPFPVAA